MTTSGGTIYFHYNGDKVIYETDANNNIVAEYTWDQQGKPVTMTRNGATYYCHLNGHGDVTKLSDATGNVVASYQYDAWGNVISQSGTMASANPYRYAGYRYDEATGLYYLMARYYDAGIGRFITRDTFHGFTGDPQSLNQYAYVYNNPLKFIDPSGNRTVTRTWYGYKTYYTGRDADVLEANLALGIAAATVISWLGGPPIAGVVAVIGGLGVATIHWLNIMGNPGFYTYSSFTGQLLWTSW